MAYLLGTLLGSFVGVAILSFIIEQFAFKHAAPLKRAQLTVGAAFAFAGIVAGFGAANGGPYVWTAWINYVPGAIVTLLWFNKRYEARWSPEE